MKMRIASNFFKTQILLTTFLFVAELTNAQLCERPDSVFLAFAFNEDSSDKGWKVERIEGQKKYVFESSKDVYFQQSEEKEVSCKFVNKVGFKTPYILRKQEFDIINCEIAKGENTKSVYVDLDINSVFKNIFLVEKRGDRFYMSKVLWYDPIE